MFKLIKKGKPVCIECKVGIIFKRNKNFPIYECASCGAIFEKQEVELGFCGETE